MTLRPLVFVDGAGACECPQESAMMKIVVYLRRIEHREFRVDRALRAAHARLRFAIDPEFPVLASAQIHYNREHG